MGEKQAAQQQVMLFAIDEGEHSFYALEWVLDHFFVTSGLNQPFKLIVVYAKPTPSSVVGLGGPGTVDIMGVVDSDLKKNAQKVLEKGKQLCSTKGVDNASFETVEGDPRNVLVEGVEKHRASLLVLGSHGYGALKRAVLGSVSDYCAHHAHCSVMIVKKPKIKH
uniref:UspA domain-containing protein n=2 Tax=Kalanchoe fedtschenkoi TaxID=63787 RepID=A0A7N1A3Y1_KALFE